MRILHRYIAKVIISASFMVIFAVLGVSFFVELLSELRDVGTGDYGLTQAVLNVILKLPHDLYQFFPMLVLLGGVLGLGILSSHHELMVMRASGISVKNLIRAVLMAAFFLIVLATLLGECVAPQAMFLGEKIKHSAENSGQAVVTKTGVWIHEGNNFLHVDRMMGKTHLEGVNRYEFDARHHLLATYYARLMDFKKGQWRLHDLSKTTFLQNRTISETKAEASWNLQLNPNLLNVGAIEPEQLSLPNLMSYSQHLVKNGLQATRFQFEFWRRVFQPFTTLVMILLAVPFVFGAPRSVTMGWRILFGVLLGFIFYILNAFLGQLSVVYQLSPIWAALLPTCIFAVMGYIVMSRAKS